MDKLKKYLQQHKAELDTDAPAGDTWEYIASQTPGEAASRRPVRLIIRYMAAAGMVILISAGVWLLAGHNKHTRPAEVVKGGTPEKKDSLLTPPGNSQHSSPGETAQNGSPVSTPALIRPASGKTRDREIEVSFGDMAMIDKSYARLIRYQLRKLHTTPVYAETPGYFAAFAAQLKQMDKDESAIKRDIGKYGLGDELLQQLINVYQQKLNILKNLQVEINKMNNRVNEKAKPSEKLIGYYLDI